jgi:hypothetical protein
MISRGIDARDDLVQEFYGINTATFKVDNVAITRSGKISQWTERGYVLRQTGSEGVRADIARYFGLTELIDVHPRTPNDKRRKVIAELNAKALQMIAARGRDPNLAAAALDADIRISSQG